MRNWIYRTSIAGILLHAIPAGAQNLPFPPKQNQICVPTAGNEMVVDKRKLAQYLLRKFPFNIASVPERLASSGPDLALRILGDSALCTGSDTCSNADKDNLDAARGNMSGVLAGLIPGFQPTEPVSPEEYFSSAKDKYQIICEQKGGKPIEAPGATFVPPPPVQSNFRIRGAVDDLYIDRSQKKDFQSTKQAVVNYASDGTARKNTSTFQGILGYRIDTGLLKENGQRIDLIPYFQVNRVITTTRTGSTAKPSANETINFGVTGSVFLIAPSGENPVGHVINLRPDYLVDFQDHSQILSMNIQYIPTINSLLNDYRRFIPDRDDVASYKLIADLRLNNGIYADRGKASVAAQNKNYSRIGGRVGLSILSDDLNIPLTFTTTYTGLHGIVGDIDIGYFSNMLTWHLDPNKYFGLSAGYTNGRREDTAKREQLWTLGLSVRF